MYSKYRLRVNWFVLFRSLCSTTNKPAMKKVISSEAKACNSGFAMVWGPAKPSLSKWVLLGCGQCLFISLYYFSTLIFHVGITPFMLPKYLLLWPSFSFKRGPLTVTLFVVLNFCPQWHILYKFTSGNNHYHHTDMPKLLIISRFLK